MTDEHAIKFTTDVFDLIKKSKTINDLEIIPDTLKILPSNRMKTEYYPKIEFEIEPEEIESLISNNIINKDFSFTKDITSILTDPLSKILYATAWKNGDLKKIKHIIKGVLDGRNIDDSNNDALVFYQFGKYLTKTPGQPIIDQHVIRAFAVYSTTNNKEVENLRKIETIKKTHKQIINNYKNWLTSENLTLELKKEKDYTYHIDKLLFATGKTIKQKHKTKKSAGANIIPLA